MALTFDQLQLLLAPDPAANLTVAAPALGTPAVAIQWQAILAAGQLVLTQASAQADRAQQTVMVAGQLAPNNFPGLTQAALTSGRFTLLPDGSVTAVLVLAVNDDSWQLSSSFPVLAGSLADAWQLSQAVLTLDSAGPGLPADFRASLGYSPNLPAVASALVPGLALAATATLADGALRTLLGQVLTLPVALSGPLVLYPFAGDAVNPTQLLLPELLLTPTGPAGPTLNLGANGLTFTPQLAVVLQEAQSDDPTVTAVLPSPVVALRCAYQPAGGWQPLALSAFFYDAQQPELALVVGSPIGQQGDVSQLTALLQQAGGISQLLAPASGFPVVSTVSLQYAALHLATSPLALTNLLVVFGIGEQAPWSVLGGLLTIQDINFSMSATSAGSGWQAAASVFASATFGSDTATMLSAFLAVPDLSFQVQLAQNSTLDLTAVVTKLIGTAAISLPSFTGASFTLAGTLPGTYEFVAELTEDWPLATGLTLKKLGLQLGTDGQTVHGAVNGTLGLGGAQLLLAASYDSAGGWVFTGEVLPDSAKPNLTALLADLAQAFGFVPPAGLPEVDLDDLRIEYDYMPGGTSTMLVLAVLSFPGTSLDLTALPLIGAHLDPGAAITLDSLTLNLDTGGASSATIGLTLAGRPQSIVLAFGGGGAAALPPGPRLVTTPATGLALADAEPPAGVLAAAPAGTWLEVQRTIGPVTVEKIGFRLSSDGLEVLVNAALSFTAFSAEVLGLGVTVPLRSPYVPKFNIDGLSISYTSPALTIAGSFLKTTNPDYLEFSGQLLVRAGSFALAALGSYATTSPPSLFAFVMVDAPIGGPPAFYVNGLAAGFGYNRNLLLPPIDQVATYPLVAGAAPGPNNPFASKPPVEVMDQYLGVSQGQNWVAGGVRVASFGMVQASLLLSVAFGNRLQIGLLGLGTLSVPAQAPTPVAFVELALEALLAPDDGILAVYAQLTSNSYVFEKECRLTGGFAFCLWFAPSRFAGDFVVTLGGYNPHFTLPANYPPVPLLGMRWQVGAALVVKGGVYFALTPHVLMAGGSLEAAWQSGPLSASFKVWADFLIYWKPFHYDIDLGATFSVVASVQVAFVRVTLTVSVGARLHLWGPAFRYRALIDLDVISFTIGDDDDGSAPAAIGWEDFKTSFLGAAPASHRALLAAATDQSPCQQAAALAPPANTVVNLVVASGVLQDLTSAHVTVSACGQPVALDYVVDPQHFALATQTQLPAKELTYNGVTQASTWNADFGVGPMQVSQGGLQTSTHAVTVCRLTAGAYYAGFVAQPTVGAAPKGLWRYEADLAATLNADTQLRELLLGVQLRPQAQQGGASQPVAVAALLYGNEGERPLAWGFNPAPTTDPFGRDNPLTTLAATIAAPTVAAERAGLLADLFYNGFALPTALDPTPLTDAARLELLDPYVLSYLGEAKTY